MVHLWQQAVQQARSLDVQAVKAAMINQVLDAPSGVVRVGANHHLTKPARIGQIQANGQFDIVVEYQVNNDSPAASWF